jgi:hypothetical protein
MRLMQPWSSLFSVSKFVQDPASTLAQSQHGGMVRRSFRRIREDIMKGLAIGAVWFAGVMLNLVIIGGVLYVAYHFISKLW